MKVLLALVSFTILSFSVFAQSTNNNSVSLAWDRAASHEASIVYRIKYGPSSGNYLWTTNAGTNVTITVRGLTNGYTYYFIATAMNTNNLESDPSNELSYSVPAALPTSPPSNLQRVK